jgi:hypothetical protein
VLRRELQASRESAAGALCSQYRFLYHQLMKTTLDIDDELLVKAKALAARERSSVTALIEEGLRLRLRRRTSPSRAGGPPSLIVYRGKGGLAPGINSLSNRSLLDAADSDA